MDDIRLIPCPSCGGQPVVLITPAWPLPVLQIACSCCPRRGPENIFKPEGDRAFDCELLPGLAEVRRRAADAWNEGADYYGGI
ncbi:MAG: hypothetical protein IJZ74_03835 [Clostridia bacterium]|nr:hypothetical protein [Clostridia bacterium]